MSEFREEDFRNYLRLFILLNGQGCEILEEIFKGRYEKIKSLQWEDGSKGAEEFLKGLNSQSVIPLKEGMVGAELSGYDMVTVARLLLKMDLSTFPPSEKGTVYNQNMVINKLQLVWNKFAHLPEKSVDGKMFRDLWQEVRGILSKLGVSTDKIDELRSASRLEGIELTRSTGRTGRLESENSLKAKEMREAGNLYMQAEQFWKAIQKYSEALQAKGLSKEEMGLLYSNRSHGYLKTVLETCSSREVIVQSLELALQDAETVMELRPTWWKGYFRAGRVRQFKSDWKLAIALFDQALALNPGLIEVRKCRDECLAAKAREVINEDPTYSTCAPGYKEHLEKMNWTGSTLKTDDEVMKKLERQMEQQLKSKDPKARAYASLFFGDRYVQGEHVRQDMVKGVKMLQDAVEGGVPEAMCMLGALYTGGDGVPKDVQKAVRLFERAAHYKPTREDGPFAAAVNYGISMGQYFLGKGYHFGIGKPLDYYQASVWYRQSSDRGYAKASNYLGDLYHFGRGVEKCTEEAKKYWNLAANGGSELAMESLAWQYLSERKLKEAEHWFRRSIDTGNVNSVLNKDKFFSSLQRAKTAPIAQEDLFPGLSLPENPRKTGIKKIEEEINKLFEDCKSASTGQPASMAMSGISFTLETTPNGKYWPYLNDLKERADAGYPYTQKLVESMHYFEEGLKHLKLIAEATVPLENFQKVQEQCVRRIADCYKTEGIVAYYQPPDLLEVLKEVCEATMTEEKSDLDLAARICYCCTLGSFETSTTDALAFCEMAHKKYPLELYFYVVYMRALVATANREAAMKICLKGLKHFPNCDELLFRRAERIALVGSSSSDEIILAWMEFVEKAPFDHPRLPQSHYILCFLVSSLPGGDEEARALYAKGLELEEKLLPCFSPVPPEMKMMAENVMQKVNSRGYKINQKKVNKKSQATAEALGPSATTPATLKSQISNPARVTSVVRHREALKTMAENSETWKTSKTSTPDETKGKQATSLPLRGLKEIRLKDMSPNKDRLYQKQFINLLIMEDAIVGMGPEIHVICRDDNGDCIKCTFSKLDPTTSSMKAALSFGSRISILNPSCKQAEGIPTLRVDGPETIICHWSGKDKPICRFCWAVNPEHSCGACKRAKYCSRECQTKDWKDLKHKLICKLPYFDGSLNPFFS